MAGFTIDLKGRIRNFDLPKRQPLIPLFEAIVNAVYAIEERQVKEEFNGYIKIYVDREDQMIMPLQGIDNSINDIVGFRIVDNGIGLDDNNMKSFLQSDSVYRADKGGKGVGRFSWLKAFSKAQIESVYKDDGAWVKREFEFTIDTNNIDDTLVEVLDSQENRTTISLISYLPEYGKYVSKNTETIAMKIMQHCMIYLMSPRCPQISVIDYESFDINRMFEKKIKREEEHVEVDISGEKFSLLNAKISDASIGGSKLYLYANDRMVKEVDLDKEIIDLDKKIYDELGCYYVGIVAAEFLDKNVDMNRTSFDIVENRGDDEISMDDIVSAVKPHVELYLSEYLSAVRIKKEERIKRYIYSEAPQFRHLLKYMPESINKIRPSLTDNKLDEELYKIKRKFDIELKNGNKKILDRIDVGSGNLNDYQKEFEKQFEKISEANKSVLAEYVAHRKIILELLKKGIKIKDEGGFNKEAYIHNLIYPMRRTSNEIEYESHNLWLIDERLSYCEYVSSDIPFDNNPKEERTDILILDHPIAVSDESNSGREYETIVIFELKRPMRDDYSMGENPIEQLLGYVNKLSTSKMKDKDGRIIKVGKSTQFYLYAVCDITPNLLKVADNHDFKETPDRRGLYKYHDRKNAYIEILSYDKIISDAEKRNGILFDKLGIK